MLVKFNVQTTTVGIVPYHFWINKIPFDSSDPLYYVATFGNNSDLVIEEFIDKKPGDCIMQIRSLLDKFHYKIIDISVENILTPEDEFEKYLIEFKQY
ncbi:hypothetical protein [Flavobacterium sp.]